MAKYTVVMIRDYTSIYPATVLETKLGNGEVVNRIEVPERKFEYKVGQEFSFKNKKDMLGFLQKMNGAAILKP